MAERDPGDLLLWFQVIARMAGGIQQFW